MKKRKVMTEKQLIDQSMLKMLRTIQNEKSFLGTPAGQVATYFKNKLKSNGFVMDNDAWAKTMETVEQVILGSEYSHVTCEDWMACIDWIYSHDRFTHKFWGKVNCIHFTTVTKMYNEFNAFRTRHKNTEQQQSSTIRYGRK